MQNKQHKLIASIKSFAYSILFACAYPVQSTELVQQVPAPNKRIYVQEQGDLKISAAVPSADETRDIFGTNLYARNIQPIWIQIENLGDTEMWLLPVGIDQERYNYLETASRHFKFEKLLKNRADRLYQQSTIRNSIDPGEARAGYVFSRVDEGTKSFNVDIVRPGDSPLRETFFVPVPGLRIDHYQTDFNNMYSDEEVIDVDLQGLIRELEALPCCVKDAKSKNNGDPLNIAFVGDLEDIYYSFLRAGWDETETVNKGSLWKMLKSSIFVSDYRYSPVSALYVYGRPQDIALQRTRQSIHQRNHLRLWMTPMKLEGKPVWIGQISRDIGVRFTKKTITTHKIDADVDETREFLVEDMFYSQGLSAIGYVRGVGEAPYDAPRGNLTGDPYFTDGLRVVMWVSGSPVELDEVKAIPLSVRPGLN